MAKQPPVTKATISPSTDKVRVDGGSAQARYDSLTTERNPFHLRAIDNATLTIPYLFPPMGHTGSTILPTPYQGTGARGLNNLAAKLLMALLPPNEAFFRFQIDDFTLQKITKQEGMRALVDKALASVERAVMNKIEVEAIRVPAFEAFKQLIVSGNALCHLKPEGGMKVYRLDRYVVWRNTMGKLLGIIVKEDVTRKSLDSSQMMAFIGPADHMGQDSETKDGDVAIYTSIILDEDAKQWNVCQEVCGRKVPGSDGHYPEDKSAWFPLRWTCVDNEDYGRGYVEEYLGDLKSLEALTKALVQGAQASAKVLFLVNPNGSTNARQIAEAPNGAVRSGNKDDVTVMQMDKYADFKVAKDMVDQITQRLSFAFLLNTSVQRQGERVTAEEIKFMAGELEDALGGVYSVLTQEFQYPLVTRLMFDMERKGQLPKLPHDLIKPTITTGLEALGRGNDLTKLQQFMQALNTMGPQVAEQIAEYLVIPDMIKRVGTSLSIDTDGLIKTDQEYQADQQAKQQQESLQANAPHLIKGISDNLKQAQANQGQGQSNPPQQGSQNG